LVQLVYFNVSAGTLATMDVSYSLAVEVGQNGKSHHVVYSSVLKTAYQHSYDAQGIPDELKQLRNPRTTSPLNGHTPVRQSVRNS
jgi:hypothetical protein